MKKEINPTESVKFAGFLREGLAQHLAGTLLAAHALALRLRKNESTEVVEAGQLVSLLHAAIDDLSDLIFKLQSGTDKPGPLGGPASLDGRALAKLIHDKLAQDAAAATLSAGLLRMDLVQESHPKSADAQKLEEILKRLAENIVKISGELDQ